MIPAEKVKYISNWIKSYVDQMPTKAESLVIGISGGIDSSVSSTLSAMTGLKTIVFATRMNLLKLGRYKNTESVVTELSTSVITPVEPKVETEGDNIVFKIPEEAGYGLTKYVESRDANLFVKKKK